MPVTMIVGAGGVLGGALCNEFIDAGHTVFGLRRAKYGSSLKGVLSMTADLQDPQDVRRATRDVVERSGHIDVVVCNAAHFRYAPFSELELQDFTTCWQAAVGTTYGALSVVLPHMVKRRHGTVIISGATGSRRGTSGFAAFASAKFALRGLAQSLAREYQPLGIHVAHVVLDGVLLGSGSAQRFTKQPDLCIDPRSVASLYRRIVDQPSDAWTHEMDLRPRGERF